MISVLLTGSGGQASQSIIKCLRLANLGKKKFRIITTDIDPLLAGIYRGDKGYLLKKDWTIFIDKLNSICEKEKIDIIIPGSDIEIDFLSKRRNLLTKPLLLAGHEVIEITRDKWKTNLWLKENNYPYPKTFLGIPELITFPAIIKPRHGWGSNDQFKVDNLDELIHIKKYILNRWKEDQFITQEFLQGQELSGMAMVAKDGEILGITCAESWKKFGMSYKTIHGSEKDDLDFKLLVSKIIGRLGATGPVSVQAFRTGSSNHMGEIKIFELNPRFTGAQIVRALGGVNIPEILIENWLIGKKERPIIERKFIALWHSDYIYLTWEDYQKLKEKEEIEKTGEEIKLL